MNKSTVGVHLTLIGDDFELSNVSSKLGIFPTYTRNKDELLKNGREFGRTEWGIGFECEPSIDIEDQYRKILSMVQDKTDILTQLCVECDAEWHILFVVYIENGDVPALYLSKGFIAFAAAIGAQVGFDTYVLSAREDGVMESTSE